MISKVSTRKKVQDILQLQEQIEKLKVLLTQLQKQMEKLEALLTKLHEWRN